MKQHYLYKITNLVNGKMYIGVTKDPKHRKWQHFNHRHPDTMSTIKYAIDKYGKDSFTFEVICIGSKEYILELESKAIALYDTIAPSGYNLSKGGEGGAASSITKRSDDKPVYLTGFWFPNFRTAKAVTGIPRQTIRKWIGQSNSGDIYHAPIKEFNAPVYVGGFWFTTSKLASEILDITVPAVNKRIREGFVEQQGSRNFAKGGSHPHTGKTGDLCHNSKSIVIEGVEYPSQVEAVAATGYSPSKIYRRLKSNHPDFQYKEVENV